MGSVIQISLEEGFNKPKRRQNSLLFISMMSFIILPPEIKVKIFNMVSIGSLYNASLVWKEDQDMANEVWK